jgi:hypothetical protein
MAYTIKVHDSELACERARVALYRRIESDGRFTADLVSIGGLYRGARKGSRKEGHAFVLRTVRLTEAKPYCGQHPGECLVNPLIGPTKKMKAKYLEWDDWVQLHALVNDVLDELDIDADVWSEPNDVKGKMWIRKGMRRRVRYDYEDDYSGGRMLPLRVWNTGTDDQFVADQIAMAAE